MIADRYAGISAVSVHDDDMGGICCAAGNREGGAGLAAPGLDRERPSDGSRS
jgi:hypothetical protein